MASGIYQLPTELLLAVFAHLNKQDLASLRLTSHHLEDVASQIYLDSVTIALRRQTLVDLDSIARHPGLRKGVKRVNFDISQYDDRVTDKEVYARRLVAMLRKELEDYRRRACRHHHYKLAVRMVPRYQCTRGLLCNPKAMLELEKWIELCEDFPHGSTTNKLWLTRRRSSICNGYERYCELARDQKHLAQSGKHVRLFSQALERLPFFKSLWVGDLSGASMRSSITLDGRNGHSAFCLDRTPVSFVKHTAAFDLSKILLAWENLGMRLQELTCKEPDAWLQMLHIWDTRPVQPPYKSLLKHLVTLELKIKPRWIQIENNRERLDSVILGQFHISLGFMLSQAEALQSLTMDGSGSPDRLRFHVIEKFAYAWKNIKHIGLKNLVIDFEEFMTFCVLRQTTLVSLEFDDVKMENGDWYDTLEIFRTAVPLENIRFHGIEDATHSFLGSDEILMARYAMRENLDDLLRGTP